MSRKRNYTNVGPSQRMLRVSEVIKHRLSELLTRGMIHDKILETHVITIPEVRITPDLRTARAFVMPLGGKDATAVLDALRRHKKFIRAEVAHALNLKFAPDLEFSVDETFDEASRINALLSSEKVKEDLKKKD